MRFILIFLTLAACTANASVNTADYVSDTPYDLLLAQTGITKMLGEFPADVQVATARHAKRCASSASRATLTRANLQESLISTLSKQTESYEIKQLVDWYNTRLGKKIFRLERRDVDEKKLSQFKPDALTWEKIRQIYQYTDTGKFSANIAVELEYAGWLLSGCVQQAQTSGDIKRLQAEVIRAQVIKKEAATLEALLEHDTLHVMAYLLSSLSEAELDEYVEITQRHTEVLSALVQSLMSAIRAESTAIAGLTLP